MAADSAEQSSLAGTSCVALLERGSRYLQKQKQALTQIRGAGSLEKQPHIGFAAEHSVSELHSL
jgi:hypothetical protein